MPFFSCVAMSASMMLPRRHSSMKACSAGSLAPAASRERMLGGDRHECHAQQRVGARGEYLERAVALMRADVWRTGNAMSHALGSPIQLACMVCTRSGQSGQLLERRRATPRRTCVMREVVHRDLALLDRARPCASRGRRSPARWRARSGPPDPSSRRRSSCTRCPSRACAGTATGSSGSNPGRRWRSRATSRCAKPSDLQLALHVGDVVARPLRRRHAVLHRRVLGRQAERVPAHGLQHVVALHAHEAREHVADGVVAHVAHVQPARSGTGTSTGSSTWASTASSRAANEPAASHSRLDGRLDFLGFVTLFHRTGKDT